MTLLQTTRKNGVPSSLRFIFLIVALGIAGMLGACASPKQPARAIDDPRFQKAEGDHQIHGEVEATYGHSAGRGR